jgi:hypothetical protein
MENNNITYNATLLNSINYPKIFLKYIKLLYTSSLNYQNYFGYQIGQGSNYLHML